MAERNMEATLSAFREAGDAIPTAYDLSLPELSRLVGRARTPQGACEAIGSAFRYGFILGSRAQRAKDKKRRSSKA